MDKCPIHQTTIGFNSREANSKVDNSFKKYAVFKKVNQWSNEVKNQRKSQEVMVNDPQSESLKISSESLKDDPLAVQLHRQRIQRTKICLLHAEVGKRGLKNA